MTMELTTVATWALCIGVIVAFQFLIGGGRARVDVKAIAKRQDLHLQRKAQHAVTGLMIYVVSGMFPVYADVTVLFTCALAFYGLHALRKRSKRVDMLYLRCFHGLLRREEIQKAVLPGAFYFLVGSGLVLSLFPTAIARLAILHLSFGDPSASLIGSRFGRRRLASGKSFEGFLGCWIVASLVTWVESGISVSITHSALRGLCAAVAESIDFGWDDNLSLPVISALLQTGLTYLGTFLGTFLGTYLGGVSIV
ncbi:hypothetical protein Poli38472_001782 [Pythium oligandrum]|uniref:Dolichol kinase n=1 Tax=Pythium oligandrum TaxID=41045 RepID=A0A8K1CVZ7_PYTOL|nr:hypothetical protein Poli38472_001782 [Pythium oligandrum]|eukprot:TMW69626.1 hypothetical protein Poli38472_001782 [Pythium oligandrum]